MRAYLGFAGGLAAERVLGSASTWSPGANVGVLGRAMAAGDRLVPVRRGDLDAAGRTWPEAAARHPAAGTGPIRFVPGPDLRQLPVGAAEAFAATTWTAATAIDRMGIRLDGAPMKAGGEILSHPIAARGRPGAR